MSKMLSSWKEIAHFFGKGVRTVQRWEKTLDLPIHRPPGAPSNVVLARTSDLEEWMHRGPVSRVVGNGAVASSSSDGVTHMLSELEQEILELSDAVDVQAFETKASGSTEERILALTAQVAKISTKLSSAPVARAA